MSWAWLGSVHVPYSILQPLQSHSGLLQGKGHPLNGTVSNRAHSFQSLNSALANAPVLAYFDKDANTSVVADASPVGVGAVLIQKDGVSRAVCYVSRRPSDVERRYSQTEKKALVVWCFERFNLYLQGLESFDLVTDHEPLKVIYSTRSKPSAHIERWVLRLQPYSYRVRYVRSRENNADVLLPLVRQSQPRPADMMMSMSEQSPLQSVPVAMNIQKIEKASVEDSELVSGKWRLGSSSQTVHTCED